MNDIVAYRLLMERDSRHAFLALVFTTSAPASRSARACFSALRGFRSYPAHLPAYARLGMEEFGPYRHEYLLDSPGRRPKQARNYSGFDVRIGRKWPSPDRAGR